MRTKYGCQSGLQPAGQFTPQVQQLTKKEYEMTIQKKAGELSMTDRFDGVKSVPSITTNQASTPRPWTVDAMGYIRGPNSENILENKDNAEFICDMVNQAALTPHPSTLKRNKKYGFTYDGSRDFTVGLLPDPQAQPIANVWDNDFKKGQAKAKLVCDALNGCLVETDRGEK